MEMDYEMLVEWANGRIKMYLVADGDMRPIDYYQYSILPLRKLPKNARLTPDTRLAFILAEHQKAQKIVNS